MEELDSNITIVTFYFDLYEREESRNKSKSRDYMDVGKYVLDLDVNMFIFVDPKFVADVWKRRSKFISKTFIYPIEFENTPYYSKRVYIEKMFAKGKRPKGTNTVTDSPLYLILTWTKMWAISTAIEINLFNTSSFFWLDFGLFHLWEDKVSATNNLKQSISIVASEPKIRICIIKEDANDTNTYYSRIRQLCAGGYFGGSKEYLKTFLTKFKEELEVSLSCYPSLEEAIIYRIYYQNKDLFNVKYGDYCDLVSLNKPNYTSLIIFARIINFHRKNKDWIQAIYVVDYMFARLPKCFHESWITSFKEIASSNNTKMIVALLTLLDEILISMWWSNRKEDSKLAAIIIADIIGKESNKNIVSEKKWNQLKTNIGYHGL